MTRYLREVHAHINKDYVFFMWSAQKFFFKFIDDALVI